MSEIPSVNETPGRRGMVHRRVRAPKTEPLYDPCAQCIPIMVCTEEHIADGAYVVFRVPCSGTVLRLKVYLGIQGDPNLDVSGVKMNIIVNDQFVVAYPLVSGLNEFPVRHGVDVFDKIELSFEVTGSSVVSTVTAMYELQR